MISGIGCDLVNSARINKILLRFGKKFIKKMLSAEEEICYDRLMPERQLNYLSKRFAAKEAVSKAIGTGIGRGLNFKDIEILNNELGAPYVVLPSEFYKKNPKIRNILISLADEEAISIAFAVVVY